MKKQIIHNPMQVNKQKFIIILLPNMKVCEIQFCFHLVLCFQTYQTHIWYERMKYIWDETFKIVKF